MIGIDLGTTNSCVAVRDPFGGASTVRVAVGPNPPYDTVLRSTVFDPCGSALIGGDAIKRFRDRPGSGTYLETFKPQFEEQQLRTTVIRDGGGSEDAFGRSRVGPAAWVREEVGGRWSRRELVASAELLAQHLLREALAAGGEADRILLGAPVSFSSTARKRLLCGLRHVRDRDGRPFFASWADLIERVSFVLEPVAVAAGPLRDAFDVDEREMVLVFDNGGGTLDLTLVEYDQLRGFARPMPVRQVSAMGSDRVAGSAFDAAFHGALLARKHPAARSLSRLHEQIRLQLVEDCKIELSTSETAELFGVPVTRDEFEAGVRGVVDEIEETVLRLLDTSEVTIEQVDRVIMSGGSSCVPCVQQRMRDLFRHLDASRISAPIAPDGVEAAITDVARGLVSFAEEVEDAFEQVALWDVDVMTSESDGFWRVVDRGTPFPRGDSEERELWAQLDLGKTDTATSVGVFEDQLGHRFVSGLANIPAHPEDAWLWVILRPGAAVPGLVVVDADGYVLHDGRVDLGFTEDDLDTWFGQDIGALPLVAGAELRSAPLDRLLHVGDVVEGVQNGSRFHGKVKRIRHIPSGEWLEEMPDFDSLPDLSLEISPRPAQVTTRRVCYGDIRLAQRWAA